MEPENSSRATLLIMGGGLLIGLAIGLAVFVGLPSAESAAGSAQAGSGGGLSRAPAPIVGSPAPDFTARNIAGETITLSRFRGRPVLINFWATWCGPCRIEMPTIEAAYQAHRADGLAVLAVDADEPLDLVTDFVQSLGLTFEILLDPGGRVTDLYRIRSFPTSFFVGRDGTIVAQHIGLMVESQLAANLAKILPE